MDNYNTTLRTIIAAGVAAFKHEDYESVEILSNSLEVFRKYLLDIADIEKNGIETYFGIKEREI